MAVKELMFWSRLLSLMGTVSIAMGGEGRHPRRTWREEEVRWSSGQDPSVCLSFGHRLSRLSSHGEKHVLPLHSRGLTRTSGTLVSLVWFGLVDVVSYRSSSDGCRCVFSSVELSASSLPFPLSRSARGPGPAGSRGKPLVALRFFSFFPGPVTGPLSRTSL